ncbi:MAG: 1-acyl-sn-glycerol-3-phosphate acyltransferase [Abditibacteriales bacterium]|nr:1-acyl-sn-glycerol-3-phosphate acyltransferase [Abditibacteriales bacterium]MDW8365448.1 lysophospholipid acyltransferase family protein [Abditibacteriales bacterium]
MTRTRWRYGIVNTPGHSLLLHSVGAVVVKSSLRVFCRWQVVGKENVPRAGGAIVACNHVSYLDPPVVGAAMLPRRLYYMARDDLFRVPLLSALIRRLGAFPVRRGTADRGALRMTLQLLKAGEMVLMFPEGTRSPDGTLQPPELGIAYLVAHARVPVVPVAVVGTHKVLPRGAFLPRPAPVQVRIGKPFTFDDLAPRPSREALRRVAERIMLEIGRLLSAVSNN